MNCHVLINVIVYIYLNHLFKFYFLNMIFITFHDPRRAFMKSIHSVLFFILFNLIFSSLFAQSLPIIDLPNNNPSFEFLDFENNYDEDIIEPVDNSLAEKLWLKCGLLVYSEEQNLYYILNSHIEGQFYRYKNKVYARGNFYFTNLKPGTDIPQGVTTFYGPTGTATGSARHYIDIDAALNMTDSNGRQRIISLLNEYAISDSFPEHNSNKSFSDVCVEPSAFYKKEDLISGKTVKLFRPETLMSSKDFHDSVTGFFTMRPDGVFLINNFIRD